MASTIFADLISGTNLMKLPLFLVLVLSVPEGVRSVAVPIEIPSSALRVKEFGGAGARRVRIGMLGDIAGTPRVQLTFTQGTQTCIARFGF